MKKLNIAIIGFGLSGRTFHAPFISLLDTFNLHTILSSREKEVKESYPGVNVASSYDDVLNDKDIDVVVITTPNHLHFDQARKALNFNKHVIVEKPFVDQIEKGRELEELAKSKDLTLSIFHNRRYDDDFITIKRLIKENIIGEIVYFESNFDRFRPVLTDKNWREKKESEAGGVLFDLGSHLIDQVFCLFGEPDDYSGDTIMQREGAEQDDYFSICFKYGKMRAVMGSSSIAAINKPRFLVHGLKGSIISYGLDEQESYIKSGNDISKYHSERSLKVKTEDKETIIKMDRGDYGLYYQDFYNAVVNNKKNPVTPDESLFNIKIISKLKA